MISESLDSESMDWNQGRRCDIGKCVILTESTQ